MQMKSVTLLLFFIPVVAFGQHTQADLDAYNAKKNRITRGGMYTLGAWALGNFAVSGPGWAMGQGSNKYFHMGNVMWNTVNIAIAVPGLIGSYREKTQNMNLYSTLRSQSKVDKIYYLNAGLDVAYIATGFALRERGMRVEKNADRLKGWGESLLLQGGFLLLYDTGMIIAHQLHAKRKLSRIPQGLVFYGTGFNYRYTF